VCTKPTQPCSPYFCNGASACGVTCGSIQDCQGGYYCTGVGGKCQLKKGDGGACATGDECVHGNCVDNFCCGSSSCPSCKACNVPGSEGTCSPMSAGSVDPNGTCVDQGPTSCGHNGKCDGGGGCQSYPDGTTCSQTTCKDTATLNLAGSCSGGTCQITQHDCTPFTCAASSCTSSCNVDADCAAGTYCTGPGGVCMAKKMDGDLCNPAAPNQCAFGNCVDGVCCHTACASACTSCALPGKKGVCTVVDAGSADPHGLCVDHGAASCGTNGLCDGTLAGCAIYAPTTVCSPETCTPGSSTHLDPGTCATGSCSAASEDCNGFLCDTNNTCRTTCADDTQCVQPNYYCASGTCTKTKADGATCTLGDECLHGNCVDGVCCGTASCARCQSCALVGSLGTCTLVNPGDVDPTGTCVNTAGTVGCSGTTGTCTIDGKCAMPGGSVICAAATCSDENHLTSDRFCDGNGGCGVGTIANCGAYKCQPGTPPSCLSMCTDDTSCASGNTCIDMSCAPM
jgi:hypothetical protein